MRTAKALAGLAAKAAFSAVKARSPRGTVELGRIGGLWVAAELGVRVIRLPRLVRLFGFSLADEGTSSAAPVMSPERPFSERERRQVTLTRRVARRWPAGRGPCLRECLVIGHVLREHSPVLRLGVQRDEGGSFLAHAWVQLADGRPVGALGNFVAFDTTALATATHRSSR